MYQNKVSTVHDLYNVKMMLYPSLKCISDKNRIHILIYNAMAELCFIDLQFFLVVSGII